VRENKKQMANVNDGLCEEDPKLTRSQGYDEINQYTMMITTAVGITILDALYYYEVLTNPAVIAAEIVRIGTLDV